VSAPTQDSFAGRRACTAAAFCLAFAGCGLPPIINGARFLIINDAGTDVAQLDLPDQRTCLAAQHRAGDGTARCQRTTMWYALPVNADVDLPDRTRVEGHFRSRAECELPGSLSRIGATVLVPCVPAAPRR
jgi:hypothetical protein